MESAILWVGCGVLCALLMMGMALKSRTGRLWHATRYANSGTGDLWLAYKRTELWTNRCWRLFYVLLFTLMGVWLIFD